MIDVKIGGEKKTLEVYNDEKPEDIASRFIQNEGVKAKHRKKLTNAIEARLKEKNAEIEKAQNIGNLQKQLAQKVNFEYRSKK